METLTDAMVNALLLLIGGDAELWEIIGISVRVSTLAILFATPPAILVAFLLAYGRFPGRRVLISVFSTLLSVPAVVVGLTFYLLLSRQGPLGNWQLLFTQTAMILGQIALCFPILVAMGHSALQSADQRAWETARTLGAGPFRALLTVMREVRFGLLAALLAAY
ncbi:MAG TPA: ABC transporter permease subunit, partial [Chromatiales bacterium]|nr:ABC transporter permease subunit [Chromatiales bacterium]